MYDRPTLGLDEALRGMQATLAEASGDGTPVAVAISDHHGNLVCFAAQDGVIEMSKILAPRKAFTAAIGRSDIVTYRSKVQASTGIPLELLIGPSATTAQGGVPIKRPEDSLILGGVGVSGGSSPSRDDELARAAVAAMGLHSQ